MSKQNTNDMDLMEFLNDALLCDCGECDECKPCDCESWECCKICDPEASHRYKIIHGKPTCVNCDCGECGICEAVKLFGDCNKCAEREKCDIHNASLQTDCDCGPHTFCDICLVCGCGTCGVCISRELKDKCTCGYCLNCNTDIKSQGQRFPEYLKYFDFEDTVIVERRKILENYVNEYLKRAGGNVKYKIRSTEYDVLLRAEIKSTKIKGLGGILPLSIDIFKRAPAVVCIEGTLQDILDEPVSYIEIGKDCLYVTDVYYDACLRYKFPVSELLQGTYLKLMQDSFFGLLSMDKAIELLKIFPVNTYIQSRFSYKGVPINGHKFKKQNI